MKATSFQLIQRIGLSLIAMFVIVNSGSAQTSRPAGTTLTDTQAQALLQRLQLQPNVPLAPAESLLLAQYMAAKNAAAIGAANALQPQGQVPGQMAGRTVITLPQQAPGATSPSQMAATSGALDPKKPGIVRLGMALPKADLGQGFQGTAAGEPVRSLISQYLGGPKLEIILLSALLPQQLDAEAKEKQCDYIVYSSITQKKGGGSLGFLKGASSMAGMIPMVGGMAGAAGAIAGAAASTAASGAAASMASNVKAKSDVTFEYQLLEPGNATPVIANKSTAKAKTDGEDVITPLIEAAATSIVNKIGPAK
jgi:hypothetical protein